MGARLTLAMALILLALPGASAQQMCRVESQWGTYEYPCGSGETPQAEEVEEPWWASNTFQAVLGVVGLVGSVSAGGYTYYRVRTRRRTLTVTLGAIERAYSEAKADPASGIARMAQLRAEVRAQHERGRLDDAHFLELDKRATQYLIRLRTLEVERRFAHLPPLLLNEIRRLVSDGFLSQSEADLIEVRAAAYRVPDEARAELATLARQWANEDAPRDDAAVAVVS